MTQESRKTDDKKPVKLRLKDILKKRGKKQAWLVKVTGKNKSIISRLCTGNVTNIHTNTLKAICNALNVTSMDILGF